MTSAPGALNGAFDIYGGRGGVSRRAGELPDTELLHGEAGDYLAPDHVVEAVNVALHVGQPLLVTGDPGCGKTRLAWSVAKELDLGPPLAFYTKSTSQAQDLLYAYDAVLRFHHIQGGNEKERERAKDAANYVRYHALGEAIVGRRDEVAAGGDGAAGAGGAGAGAARPGPSARRVVLIDEIDKAPRDFPNDLLNVLDKMEFEVPELPVERRSQKAPPGARPIVIITSNSERQLPLPFLRRCVFLHIEFPGAGKLLEIVRQRLPQVKLPDQVIEVAIERFIEIRNVPALNKRPATGELLAWLVALHAGAAAAREEFRGKERGELPYLQVLLKDRHDWELVCGQRPETLKGGS